MLWLVVGSLY